MSPTSPLLEMGSSATDRERIDQALRAAIVTADPYLNELAGHLLVAGGKRLRPVMSVVAGSVDGRDTIADELVLGGVSCELVHVGSLYHDDVMDEATTRRGVETVNARWGNLQAIVAGDFLLSRASEIAASLGTEVAGLLANTIGRLCAGQINEVRTTYQTSRTEAQYLESIEGKTAALFATAARIGGIVGDYGRTWIDALTAYGSAFGMVFQIVDDILDLTATEAELGKPSGHDLEEGVYTLPVLRVLAAGGPAADELSDLLGKPLEPAEQDKALAIVRSSSGIGEATEVAKRYANDAIAACAVLPANQVTEALRAAPLALIASIGSPD